MYPAMIVGLRIFSWPGSPEPRCTPLDERLAFLAEGRLKGGGEYLKCKEARHDALGQKFASPPAIVGASPPSLHAAPPEQRCSHHHAPVLVGLKTHYPGLHERLVFLAEAVLGGPRAARGPVAEWIWRWPPENGMQAA